jgi:hypothetical protein
MLFARDPLLVVWEAMNLLAEPDTYPDVPQIKKLLTDAEEVLYRLTIELVKCAETQDLSAPQPTKIVLH